jgi:dihydroorotate dehydrogenase (fumarate)
MDLSTIVGDLVTWMTEHEWSSLSEMRGNMSLLKVPDPEAYERANYMRMLQGRPRSSA